MLNRTGGVSIAVLRKLLSILLLAMLGLPVFAPMLALQAEDERGVPMCCRKGGRHQCMLALAMGSLGDLQGVTVSAPAERCPYGRGGMPVVRAELGVMAVSKLLTAGMVNEPAAREQATCNRRVSQLRTRQTRGPPLRLIG